MCKNKRIKPRLDLNYCLSIVCTVLPSAVKMVIIHMEPLVCYTICVTDVEELLPNMNKTICYVLQCECLACIPGNVF